MSFEQHKRQYHETKNPKCTNNKTKNVAPKIQEENDTYYNDKNDKNKQKPKTNDNYNILKENLFYSSC